MLNLAERSKKRCVEIEKKIGAAGSCCMDQSYFRFLFRLARKSKQSGLSKSEKSLAKRNATQTSKQTSRQIEFSDAFKTKIGSCPEQAANTAYRTFELRENELNGYGNNYHQSIERTRGNVV